jgi:hypothetical protein
LNREIWVKKIFNHGFHGLARILNREAGDRHQTRIGWSGLLGTSNYPKQHHSFTSVSLMFLGMTAGLIAFVADFFIAGRRPQALLVADTFKYLGNLTGGKL